MDRQAGRRSRETTRSRARPQTRWIDDIKEVEGLCPKTDRKRLKRKKKRRRSSIQRHSPFFFKWIDNDFDA